MDIIIIVGDGSPELNWHGFAKRWKLTPRETQIAAGLWADLKYEAIAARLGITSHTVDIHWRHIQQKLGIKGRIALLHTIYAFLMESAEARVRAEIMASLFPPMLPPAPEAMSGCGPPLEPPPGL